MVEAELVLPAAIGDPSADPASFSKCPLKSLNDRADFDSAILNLLKLRVGTENPGAYGSFDCSLGSQAFSEASLCRQP
ncbi:hypothetical protein [Bradyrhizobium australafricanum]|uniref:hypothetical protein n=1 Tax=Bradyrhizobium australafricanum TaxID=2821406 RepID=UPI001CE24669|nr:hypothetical protein [Bradyrhizobium australafricanum]